MDNNLDLEGQTAPESTRGLFDAPESPSIRKSADRRRSSIELGPRSTNVSRTSELHTVNEEGNNSAYSYNSNNQQRKYRESIHFQQQQRESADVNSFVRKQRASVAYFNSFPSKRLDDEDSPNSGLSRAEVLAETEAKLSGNVSSHSTSGSSRNTMDSYDMLNASNRQNRRLSEPNAARLYQYVNYNNSNNISSQQQQQQQQPLPMDAHRRMSFGYDDALTRRAVDNRNSTGQDWRSKSPSRPNSMTGYSSNSYNNNRLSTSSILTDSNNSMSSGSGQQRKALFASHLPFSSVVPQLKANLLVSGLLRVNKRNRSDAYVFCEELNTDIYICGSRGRNRALEGDHVAIKLIQVDQVMLEKLEKGEAKLARNNGNPVVRKPDEEDEKEIIFGGEEDVDLVPPKYCGVVMAVLDRAQKQMFSGTLGLMRPSNNKRMSRTSSMMGEEMFLSQQQQQQTPRIFWFKPTDKRVPLLAIPVDQAPAGFVENPESFEKRLFLGTIKHWPITSLHPFGTLESEMGPVDDIHVQLKAILADNSFVYQPYPVSVVKNIPPMSSVLAYETSSRRDMRNEYCYTIVDDEGDFLDNALSIRRLEDDTKMEIGFHVADITTFVEPDSALDKEARARGVDVYQTLSEKVPLWPESLREECTDLVHGQDRLAFSIVWTFDLGKKTGELVDTWYGKTIINSNAVLKNQDIQDILDDDMNEELSENDKRFKQDIISLYSISQSLRKERSKSSLFIKPPQLEMKFHQDSHLPTHISTKSPLEAERILSEFQILANTQVAQKISSHFPEHAVLRSQSGPNERKLHELTRHLNSLGYHINPSTPATLQASVEAIDNHDAQSVIITLIHKCMSPKKYFCTGAFDISRYHYYSYEKPLYTHFTSPTKRYIDTIVHRQLHAALLNETSFFFMEPQIVQRTAQHCNVKARALQNLNEQVEHTFSSYYLGTNQLEEAIVVGVQEGSFDVIVMRLGLERRIHVINLPVQSDTYLVSEGVIHLVWRKDEATVDAALESNIDEEVTVEDEEEKKDMSDVAEKVKKLSIQSRRRSASIRAVGGDKEAQKCTFPDECRQVIRPFDYVKVVVTADPIRCPPLIRVLAANPFVHKQ